MLPSGSAAPLESAQGPCCGQGCLAHICRWLDHPKQVCFLSLSVHICQTGDSSTGLWGGLYEVMSVGSPAPEKASGNPWPLCQYIYLENGGIDVS